MKKCHTFNSRFLFVTPSFIISLLLILILSIDLVLAQLQDRVIFWDINLRRLELTSILLLLRNRLQESCKAS